MNKKVITAALTGVLTTGMVAPAMANTTKDAATIYRNAYDATMKAKDFKSEDVNEVQTVILEARSAIKELKVLATEKDNKEWLGNVNDWSTIVDGVQQPILSKIIKVVEPMNKKLEAGEAVSQEEINAAVALIPTDLPLVWKNDYTSITDKAQTKLVDEAFAALKKAETEKTAALVKEAQAKIDVIKKSTKTAVTKQAEVFQGRLDAIKLYDINVTSVANITKTTIEVNFEALAEDMKDVTLTVVDNAGNTHEVKGLVLDQGAKNAAFAFKTALEELPTGEWTVNGVKYDAQEVRTVEAVKKAVKESKQIDLMKALNTKYFKDVIADNAPKYMSALKDAEIEDVASIQKVIEEANQNVDKDTLIKPVLEAADKDNQAEVLSGLKAAATDKVNAEWIVEYTNAIKDLNKDTAKFKDVQEAVYRVNKTKLAGTDYQNGASEDKVEKKLAEVEAYYPSETEADKKAKETEIKNITKYRALVKVARSQTKNQLSSALKELSNVDKNFKYDTKVNENILSYYVKEFEDFIGTINDGKISLSNIETQLGEGLLQAKKDITVKVGKAANKLRFASDAEKDKAKSDFKTSLVELEGVINDSKTFSVEKHVVDSRLKLYVDGIGADADHSVDSVLNTDYSAVDSTTHGLSETELKVIIDADKDTVNNKLFNGDASMVGRIKKVNEEFAKSLIEGEIDKIVAGTDTNYNNAEKKEAKLMALLNNETLGIENVIATNASEYLKDINKADQIISKHIESLQKFVNQVNARVEMKNATSIANFEAGLVNFVNEGGVNVTGLTNNDVSDIAYEMFKAINDDEYVIDGVSVETIVSTQGAVTNANEQRDKAVEKVNDYILSPAKTTTTFDSAVSVLKHISTDFNGLTPLQQETVIKALKDNAPTKEDENKETQVVGYKFTNYSQIRTELAKHM